MNRRYGNDHRDRKMYLKFGLSLLLKKNVTMARLRESDIHPISPKTPAPTIPTYRQKDEKEKKSRRL